jgi:hypothetical protein
LPDDTGQSPFASARLQSGLWSNAPKISPCQETYPPLGRCEPDAHLPATSEQKSLFGGIWGSYFELGFCVWRTMSVEFSDQAAAFYPPPPNGRAASGMESRASAVRYRLRVRPPGASVLSWRRHSRHRPTTAATRLVLIGQLPGGLLRLGSWSVTRLVEFRFSAVTGLHSQQDRLPFCAMCGRLRVGNSWEPQQRPHPWHRCAGGGAVHSINSGSHLIGSTTQSARWSPSFQAT